MRKSAAHAPTIKPCRLSKQDQSETHWRPVREVGCFEVQKDSPLCGLCRDMAAKRVFVRGTPIAICSPLREKALGAAFRPYVDPAPICTGFSTALGKESHSYPCYPNGEWADDSSFHKRQWSAFLQVKATRVLCRDGKFGFNLRP